MAEHRSGEFVVSTDKERLNLGLVYGFLTESYWAKGIPRELVGAFDREFALLWSILQWEAGGLCARNL